MRFSVRHLWIPLEPGHAVGAGWPAHTDFKPTGITWHWTATWDLASCDRLIGGSQPEFKGMASAHFAIGRSFEEGISQYVSLDDRRWHAGKNQTLRPDGRSMTSQDDKGTRTTLGIETVNIGFARPGVKAGPDWIRAHDVEGHQLMQIQPWPEPQIEMMIFVGRQILDRWPNLGPRHHHGHHDLCPGYKVDPAGFPFARILRGIYQDPDIPDPWSDTWTAKGRRRVLNRLGYGMGPIDDESWYRLDDLGLRQFQSDHGLTANGLWTTASAWAAYDAAQNL